MFHSLLFCLSLFSLSSFAAPSLPALFKNPFAATITSALMGPQEDNFNRDVVTVLPNRKNVYLMEELRDLKFNYQLQKNKSAPMAIVIPGTGGTAESGGALFIAERLYNLGYHTIVIDNPFSWGFTVAASRSGLPGYTPRDSEDLYFAIQKVVAKLKKEEGIRPRSYSLMGYSLGALQSLFMQRLDETQQKFLFKKVLLINPPANLLYAVQRLDSLGAVDETMSPKQKKAIYFRLRNVVDRVLEQKQNYRDPKVLQGIFEQTKLNNTEMASLIGASFRDSLRDLVFASQQVHDLKILKIRATEFIRNDRYDEARKISFTRYMQEFIFPGLQKLRGPDYSIEDLNNEASIYQFGDFIKQHKNVFLIHNQDDLIIQKSDLPWFQDQFQERALIFPFGGHCGEFAFPQFTEYLNTLFKI